MINQKLATIAAVSLKRERDLLTFYRKITTKVSAYLSVKVSSQNNAIVCYRLCYRSCLELLSNERMNYVGFLDVTG